MNNKSKWFIILMLAFISIGCSTGEWSAKDKRELVEACREEGGSKSYCNCYLDEVLDQYPNPKKFKEIDFESAVKIAEQCKE